jgi:hypothetical protein
MRVAARRYRDKLLQSRKDLWLHSDFCGLWVTSFCERSDSVSIGPLRASMLRSARNGGWTRFFRGTRSCRGFAKYAVDDTLVVAFVAFGERASIVGDDSNVFLF